MADHKKYFVENNILAHFGITNTQTLKKLFDCYGATQTQNVQLFFFSDRVIFYTSSMNDLDFTAHINTTFYKKYLINFYVKQQEEKEEQDVEMPLFKVQISFADLKSVMSLSSASVKTGVISFYLKEKESDKDKRTLRIRAGDTEHCIEATKFDTTKKDISEVDPDFNEKFYTTEELDDWNYGIIKVLSKILCDTIGKNKVKGTSNRLSIRIGYSLLIETSDHMGKGLVMTPISGFLSSSSHHKDVKDKTAYKVTTGNHGHEFLKKATAVGGGTGTCTSTTIVASKKEDHITIVLPLGPYGECVIYFQGKPSS